MAKRNNLEKVIKDIEECLSASCRGFRPRESCPYNDDEWDIMRDALDLLKEQEPKQVIGIADSIDGIEVGYCPSCDRAIVNKKIDETKFCRYCGQELKWK